MLSGGEGSWRGIVARGAWCSVQRAKARWFEQQLTCVRDGGSTIFGYPQLPPNPRLLGALSSKCLLPRGLGVCFSLRSDSVSCLGRSDTPGVCEHQLALHPGSALPQQAEKGSGCFAGEKHWSMASTCVVVRVGVSSAGKQRFLNVLRDHHNHDARKKKFNDIDLFCGQNQHFRSRQKSPGCFVRLS